MNEQDWERFFELVKKIFAEPRPWKEKSELVVEKAKENDCETILFEFVNWYGGSFGEDDDDSDLYDDDSDLDDSDLE